MTTKVGRYASVMWVLNRAQWYQSWYQWDKMLRAFQSLRVPVRAPKLSYDINLQNVFGLRRIFMRFRQRPRLVGLSLA